MAILLKAQSDQEIGMETISNSTIFKDTSACGFNMTTSMSPPPTLAEPPMKLVNTFLGYLDSSFLPRYSWHFRPISCGNCT